MIRREETATRLRSLKRTGLKLRAVSCGIALCVLSASGLKADSIAYMGTVSGEFGTIDLNTGVFTSLGNSGLTLAGMAVASATLFGSSYHTAAGDLYTINPANGAVTVVGTSGIDYDDFGSTTTGLYAIGTNADLYSINASTGAASLIGATGLTFGTWRSLSTNSSSLYFSNGTNLYTISTTTGAATLVGSMGSVEEGAMLLEGGILYGGDDSPGGTVDTLNVTTGAATVGPSVSGTSSAFFALAPNPLPSSSTPEPGTLTLAFGALLVMAGYRTRRRLARELRTTESVSTVSP
jgi:hypothetical protein